MDFLQNESQPGIPLPAAEYPSDCNRIGILLCRDLIFTTKVQRTALDLGYQIVVIGEVLKARSEIESVHPRLVLIDLTANDLSAASLLREYVTVAGPETWVVAFGPHVEAETLARARAAGCQVVLPRSKFAGDLPRLLQFWFSRVPGDG
jgi:DNA-binding NarL/FixJ family response regulator